MTTVTQPADVPLPDGADREDIDDWQTDDGVTSRLVWSLPDPNPQQFGCDVRVVACQRVDGSIITDGPHAETLVYVDDEDYSLAHARILAQALIEAVDLADRWAGKHPDTRIRTVADLVASAAADLAEARAELDAARQVIQ